MNDKLKQPLIPMPRELILKSTRKPTIPPTVSVKKYFKSDKGKKALKKACRNYYDKNKEKLRKRARFFYFKKRVEKKLEIIWERKGIVKL